MPIHAAFGWVFGAQFPQILTHYLNPKKVRPWAERRNHIKHEYRQRVGGRKKDRTGQKKSQKGYISPIGGEAPLKRSASKIV